MATPLAGTVASNMTRERRDDSGAVSRTGTSRPDASTIRTAARPELNGFGTVASTVTTSVRSNPSGLNSTSGMPSTSVSICAITAASDDSMICANSCWLSSMSFQLKV